MKNCYLSPSQFKRECPAAFAIIDFATSLDHGISKWDFDKAFLDLYDHNKCYATFISAYHPDYILELECNMQSTPYEIKILKKVDGSQHDS